MIKNNFKIALLYLLFSIVYIVISFFIAYSFWWRIDEGSAQFFIIVFSAMICRLGIGYLSTLISSELFFHSIEEIVFVSPFTVVFKGFFFETKGLRTAKIFKTIFSLFAFHYLFFAFFHFIK